FLIHSIQIEPQTGITGDGEYAYGSAITYSGRIVNKVKRVTDFQGNERVSNTTIYVNATSVNPLDRLTLPSGYEPQTPPMLRVDRIPDEKGIHHVVIYG